MSRWLRGLLALGLVAMSTSAFAADAPVRGDVRRGWDAFISKACVRCHAIWGHGGEIGPDLGRTRAGGLTDAELAAAMWNHIPRMWDKKQEEGIPHVAISETEMADLFAYLSFVRALDEPGDPKTGQVLLKEKKCSTCHTVTDEGHGVAPDLRKWAKYRNPAVWAQVMFEHAGKMVEEMKARGITPPTLESADLVHIVSYVRSLSASSDSELLDPGDPVLGEKLFHERKCIQCHSIRGQGGNVGPDLGRRGWVTSFTDVTVKAWNRVGGMRNAMAQRKVEPPKLTPQEMAHIVSFLFASSYADPPGSAERGARLLKDKSCLQCHGAGIGPSLEDFRGRAGPVTVTQALWMHGPTMLERMRDLGIRWPSFTGEEMRDLAAALNEAQPQKGPGPDAPKK